MNDPKIIFSSNSIYSFFATINVVLPLVGYAFVTSIFSNEDSLNSQLITIPYRAFTLLISLITIVIVPKKTYKKTPSIIYLFYFFWFLITLRFMCDVITIPTLPQNRASQIFLYIICLTIIPCIGIVRTYMWIDLKKCLYYSYLLSSIAIIVVFISNPSFQEAAVERLNSNGAMGSITSGQMALTNIILGIIILKKENLNNLLKFIIIGIILLAILVMLRSGSRGPVLSLIVVSLFFLLANAKRPLLGIVIVLVSAFIVFIAIEYVKDLIQEISPILKARLFDREDQTWDRVPLYNYAINSFLNSPIIGEKFGVYYPGQITYPHNIFLETLMQLGLIGGIMIFIILGASFKYSYEVIHRHPEAMWIALLYIKVFSYLCVSGSYTTEPSFSVLFILLVLKFYEFKTKKT